MPAACTVPEPMNFTTGMPPATGWTCTASVTSPVRMPGVATVVSSPVRASVIDWLSRNVGSAPSFSRSSCITAASISA